MKTGKRIRRIRKRPPEMAALLRKNCQLNPIVYSLTELAKAMATFSREAEPT